MDNFGNASTYSADSLSFSTDEICRGSDTTRCLSDDLDTIEANIAALQTGKANTNHTHSDYMTEDDAVAAFATINHTHTGYATATHTHSDLETLIEALDTDKADANHTHTGYAAADHTHTGYASSDHTHDYAATNHTHTNYAETTHTHAQSDITGLVSKLNAIDDAIAALQDSGSDEVQPMLIASMHLGKLDNNSGAEVASTTRICSDPFAIQNGKSYWQVNDKEVNMYVLIYDSDEVFLSYLGNFASGAEIAVNNASAAYMRIGSTLGEYDLTNEFRIYDVDPSSSGDVSADVYTKSEADARFASISHAHTGYAATDHAHTDYASTDHTHSGYAATDHTHSELHTHSNQSVLNGITAEKVSAWDSASSSAPSTVDAYTKAESDAKYALASHTHTDYMTTTAAGNTFAPLTHTHAGYASSTHTHSYNDLTDVPSDQGSYTHPATHPASMITGLATVATSGNYNDLTNKPTSLPADGGDADTVGGNYPSAFASASHTHNNYLPLSGGSITGNLNVGGIFRVNNQQSVYDDGSMITLSTNNRQTMIAGSAIYSKQTIQVSSDERLKENVEFADPEDCMEFVNNLDVKTFNYIGDDTPCIGVIAQDLQGTKFEKFFVSKQSGEEGYLAVKAADLVFPLIVAVQNLSAEVDYLKSKI